MSTFDNPTGQDLKLLEQIEVLNKELALLRKTNQDLQIQLEMTIEHGDAVEDQLHSEIQERHRAEAALQSILEIVSKKNMDLEIILETTAEHGDLIENELRKTSEAKTAFLSNLSHELRSPLNTIIGFAQLMSRDKYLKQEHHETLHTIMRSGEHLLNLINDVLSLAKIESGKLTLSKRLFNTKELLSSIYNMFRLRAETKATELKFDISEKFPTFVFGDEGKLQQVLINLLSNAIKFTDQGSVNLLADWTNGQAKFTISDTGIGIAEQDIDSMFLPFFQTETASKITGSTGLGLAISRSLVKLMGGDINVTSSIGKGTTFSFSVEITPSPEDENLMDERKVLRLADDSHKFNILVVDNNLEHQLLLSQLLKSVNFQVDVADNGKQAFDKWQNNKFHLIFMDIRMPELNGVETTNLIRDREKAKNLPPMPIIALSANVFEQTRDTMFSAGCNDFINKPFRESELFNKLAEYLDVTYIYEELKGKSGKEKILIKERLLKLPKEWLDNFRSMLAKGFVEDAKALVNQERSLDPELFDELETLLKNYQFDEIDSILSDNYTS